jgi:HEAT repeat protein
MTEQAQILSLLEQSDPESLREGAELAGDAAMVEAIPALVRNINSPNIGVQEAAERALRKIGGSRVVHAVIPLLRSENVPARNIAMDMLRELGSNDFPALEKLLHDEDADIRIFASDILGSLKTARAVAPLCTALLHDPEVNVRYQAAVSLGNLAYADCARCLNSALEDEEWVQFAVIEALSKIGNGSSSSALIKALDQSSDLVASIIVDAVGGMGDVKSVPLLLRRLEASPAPLRNKIIRAILNIMGPRSLTLLGGKSCERLRGYLPSLLEDEDPEVQDAAVKGLAALGGQGATACLLRHASSLDPEQEPERIALAIEAMISLGHTPDLDDAVLDGDDLSMRIAMRVLLSTDEEGGIPLLMDVFWKRSRDIQRIIIVELAERAGWEYQSFFLDVLARHTDGLVLRGALLYLGRKGDPDMVLEKILPLLDHKYNDVKESALEALINLHTPAVEEYFRGMLDSENPVRRMMGAYGLGFFDIDGAMDDLDKALNDENAEVRKVAVLAFGRSGHLDGECLKMVESRLHDENSEVRMAVFDTLGLCSDEGYVSSLITGLSDSDTWVRVRCAERLGEKKAAAAVEPLVGMLADENPIIIIKAVNALGMIGGEAAFRALLPLLDHPDTDLREAAEEAVNAIHRQAGE